MTARRVPWVMCFLSLFTFFLASTGAHLLVIRRAKPEPALLRLPPSEEAYAEVAQVLRDVGDQDLQGLFKELEMKYGIKVNGKLVAAFEHRSDRHLCAETLEEWYSRRGEKCELELVDVELEEKR